MASAGGGGVGGSLGGRVELSKRRKASRARARRREEQRWAALNGPVTVRRVGDVETVPGTVPGTCPGGVARADVIH